MPKELSKGRISVKRGRRPDLIKAVHAARATGAVGPEFVSGAETGAVSLALGFGIGPGGSMLADGDLGFCPGAV